MDVTAKKMKASRMVKVKCVAEESSSLQMDPATSDNSKTIENMVLESLRMSCLMSEKGGKHSCMTNYCSL